MEVKPHILITGANGQLGKSLRDVAGDFPSFTYTFLSREDLPVDDAGKLNEYFALYQPVFLINCAAYTAVDKAEMEKELAYQVNAAATGMLADLCKQHHCRFIHISTDYVFDGSASVPYTEDAATNPQSIYGASKLEGEQEAMSINPESLIIRTSWVYSEHGKNFVKTMIRLMCEKEEINVVNDQQGSPTYAGDLARAILQIINYGKWQPGIYHFSNRGSISWYEFAIAIKEMINSTCQVNPISTKQYPTPARRPAYSVLDTAKITSSFGISPRPWQEGLAACIDRL